MFFFVFYILLINLILKFLLGDIKWYYIENISLWLVLIISSLIGFYLASYNLKTRLLIRFSFLVIFFLLGFFADFSIDVIDAFHETILTSNTIYVMFCDQFSIQSKSNFIHFTISLLVYFLSNWVIYFSTYKLVNLNHYNT